MHFYVKPNSKAKVYRHRRLRQVASKMQPTAASMFVSLPVGTPIEGFVPRAATAFQVKVPDMPRGAILAEMKPGGSIGLAIEGLSKLSGAYFIVSATSSTSDSATRSSGSNGRSCCIYCKCWLSGAGLLRPRADCNMGPQSSRTDPMGPAKDRQGDCRMAVTVRGPVRRKVSAVSI